MPVSVVQQPEYVTRQDARASSLRYRPQQLRLRTAATLKILTGLRFCLNLLPHDEL